MAKKVIEADGVTSVRVYIQMTKGQFARIKKVAGGGGVSEHLRRVLREYIESFTGDSDEA